MMRTFTIYTDPTASRLVPYDIRSIYRGPIPRPETRRIEIPRAVVARAPQFDPTWTTTPINLQGRADNVTLGTQQLLWSYNVPTGNVLIIKSLDLFVEEISNAANEDHYFSLQVNASAWNDFGEITLPVTSATPTRAERRIRDVTWYFWEREQIRIYGVAKSAGNTPTFFVNGTAWLFSELTYNQYANGLG